MTIKRIEIEIDETTYMELKDIAMSLYPGVIPPPTPDEIVKFLIDNYKKNYLGGASIITDEAKPKTDEEIIVCGAVVRKSSKPKIYALAVANKAQLEITVNNILKKEKWGIESAGSVMAMLESDLEG